MVKDAKESSQFTFVKVLSGFVTREKATLLLSFRGCNMDHVDLLELRISDKTLIVLAIVIDETGDVSLDGTPCDLLDELLAEVLEIDIQGLVKFEPLLKGDLMDDSLVLSEELLILLKLAKIVLSEGAWWFTRFFFNFRKTRRLKLIASRISSLGDDIINILRV